MIIHMKNYSYKCFESFSNKLRMSIIAELRKKPLSVDGLSERLGAEQSRVSHSLKTLRECGFVNVERKGKERIYSLCSCLGKGIELSGRGNADIFKLIDAHAEKHCAKCRVEQ